ncbi:MFS transporter [Chloroflexota bacterium]
MGTLSLLAALRLPLSRATSISVGDALKRERHQIWAAVLTIIKHRGILLTSFMEAVQYFAFGCLEVFLPIYLDEQAGFTTISIGLLFTVQIIVATLTKPVMGRLSDKYGRVIMITGGLVLGGITMALMAYSQNYLVLAILVGLFGLGLATVTASTAALVADLSEVYSYGSALGVLSSIMDIGHSTGPMVGGLLVSAYRYKTAFGVVGATLIVASVFFSIAIRRIGTQLKAGE